VLVIFIFFLLSGCGLIINDILEDTETTDIIEFQIIYQGFYYENNSTKIFGDEFKFNDLISVSINSTSNVLYNDKHYNFSSNDYPNNDFSLIIYSRDENIFKNNITPPNLIITKQSTLNLILDLQVGIAYEATDTESGDVFTDYLTFDIQDEISTDTSNVSELKLIIGLDASGNLVYDLLKDNDFNYTIARDENDGIYYVFDKSFSRFYSTLVLNGATSIIYYPSSWGKFDVPLPY